jgi:hypothetical protein
MVGIMVLGAMLTVVGLLAALGVFTGLVLILATTADLIAGGKTAQVAPVS